MPRAVIAFYGFIFTRLLGKISNKNLLSLSVAQIGVIPVAHENLRRIDTLLYEAGEFSTPSYAGN
jgi:hypothetical protein